MPIDIHCGGCGAQFQVADAMAGKKGKCPECQAVLLVPASEESEVLEVVEEGRPDEVRICSECGTEYDEAFVVCTSCGFNVQTGVKIVTREGPTQKERQTDQVKKHKDPFTKILFGLIFRPSPTLDTLGYQLQHPDILAKMAIFFCISLSMAGYYGYMKKQWFRKGGTTLTIANKSGVTRAGDYEVKWSVKLGGNADSMNPMTRLQHRQTFSFQISDKAGKAYPGPIFLRMERSGKKVGNSEVAGPTRGYEYIDTETVVSYKGGRVGGWTILLEFQKKIGIKEGTVTCSFQYNVKQVMKKVDRVRAIKFGLNAVLLAILYLVINTTLIHTAGRMYGGTGLYFPMFLSFAMLDGVMYFGYAILIALFPLIGASVFLGQWLCWLWAITLYLLMIMKVYGMEGREAWLVVNFTWAVRFVLANWLPVELIK